MGMNSIRHSFMQQADARAAGTVTAARMVERDAGGHEAYAMRTMAKTNAKTNVTSIITAPEKRKTSESSITRLSA